MDIPTIHMVNDIIDRAQSMRASDIHIDPQSDATIVRFRIDGLLQPAGTIRKEMHQEFVARIKIMAGLRTDERMVPQDGRYTVSGSLDLRVTTVASYHGESVVMRLLERSAKNHSLTLLGFSDDQQETISEIIQYPNGLILVTGPTGSGKTTTLYSLLSMLNRSTHSIITIEDPIEYAMTGIRQLQVQAKRGLNFANGLRSVLRQDPDIIMVGEIRDAETALIAIQAALTGHLVISTLHTNSATASILRLMDMGIEPYLISATLRLVINQRLLRTVCKKCAKEKLVTDAELQFAFSCGEYLNVAETLESFGCAECAGTGYKGRTVVAEVLPIGDELKKMLSKQPTLMELEDQAKTAGMLPLITGGLRKWINHETTFEELARIRFE